jgi:hypothetical protein
VWIRNFGGMINDKRKSDVLEDKRVAVPLYFT